MDPATITATVAAVGSTIALLITSLRKRQDTSFDELKAKVVLLQSEVVEAERERDEERGFVTGLRKELRTEQNFSIAKDRIIAQLRRILARNEIVDPTEDPEKEI